MDTIYRYSNNSKELNLSQLPVRYTNTTGEPEVIYWYDKGGEYMKKTSTVFPGETVEEFLPGGGFIKQWFWLEMDIYATICVKPGMTYTSEDFIAALPHVVATPKYYLQQY